LNVILSYVIIYIDNQRRRIMEGYVTEQELCKLLKISKMTAYRWRKDGMPYKKINRAVRYKLSEVERWLDSVTKNE
jgi:excisionase family DNA binding protein